MALEFTVDHDHTAITDVGEEQLIGWIYFTVQTRPGDFQVRDSGAPTPRTITLPRRTAYLAVDGHLYKDEAANEPFRLVANDPAFNLDHITYRAEFNLTTLVGESIPVRHCYFPAPSTDTTAYLTRFIEDPDQIVLEVRTKGYAEDILDATAVGIALVKAANSAEARTALGIDLTDLDEYEGFANRDAFPVTGVDNVVYVALDTGKLWRWATSDYAPAYATARPEDLPHVYFSAATLAGATLPATGTLDSTHPYVVTHSGGTGFDIVSGALQSDVSLCYLNFGPLPGPIREFWMETSWSDDSEATDEPAVMIVADGPFANNYPTSYANAAFHLLIYPDKWVLQKRVNTGPGVDLKTWNYTPALPYDQRHQIGMVWDGRQVTVIHAEGRWTEPFDADMQDWWGPYGCAQIVGSASGNNKVSIHSFSATGEVNPAGAGAAMGLDLKVDKTTLGSRLYGTTTLGDPTLFSITANPTENTVPVRDPNGNLFAQDFIASVTSTATAAGTTVLTTDSTKVQIFTGSTTQTVQLPTTDVFAGQTYIISNQSSGAVTVQSSGANTVLVVAAGGLGVFMANVNLPTAAAHWAVVNGENKVTQTATVSQVYGTTSGGAQTTFTAASAATANSVALRGTGGRLLIGTPTIDGEAATKLYVDAKTINTQTGTSYTLVLTDGGKLVTLNNAAAIALTVPQNSSVAFPTGTVIELAQLGAGQVTVGGAGVTLQSTPGLKISAQYGAARLVKLATDTWLVTGDLAA